MILHSKQVASLLESTEAFSFNESFELSVACSSLLYSDQVKARDIVIRIRNKWDSIPEETKSIWNDLTEAVGLYPYIDATDISISSMLRYEYHKSKFLKDIYFHQEQLNLSFELLQKKAVVVSAPTSFGKSLLIEEVVASSIYKQIVIIQPTLALLDETRKKLKKYANSYKLIVSTNQLPDNEKGNIFLFTAERVAEYSYFINVDFFVIDEFYKLSIERDDDRAIILNHAFYKLLKKTNKFYLLGPGIKSIPQSFLEKIDFKWLHSDFSTVSINEKVIRTEKSIKRKRKEDPKKETLFEFLRNTSGQTLIYCSSPQKAVDLCIEFFQYKKRKSIITRKTPNEIKDIIDWLSANISKNWSLIQCLKSGISFHNGALPRHLGSSIIDAFNSGNINFIFCTSTLIEGINTSTKNVVLFDNKKGHKNIDFFDFKNISGRSGRMKKHYIGNVYYFDSKPQEIGLDLDIPIFQQTTAPSEVLITLDENDLTESAKDKIKEFLLLPKSLQELIKRNPSIGIKNQLNVIKELESHIHEKKLFNWTGYPTYEQLVFILDLCWRNFLKPRDNRASIVSAKQLAYLTLQYCKFKSIHGLISHQVNNPNWDKNVSNQQERLDRSSLFVLNIARHWFDYKLPKWLLVVSDLQEYVSINNGIEPGNFHFFANHLEHSFLPSNLAALLEYDIPKSAISKLQTILDRNTPPETLANWMSKLSTDYLKSQKLLNYEIKKIRNAI